MSTKDIRPTHAYIPCDICGRTLLRGERVEVFIGGGNRHDVCELCKPRALQEGWIREGSVPDYDPSLATQDRRRSMFGRRRRGRDQAGSPGPAANLDDALSGDAWPSEPAFEEPAPAVPSTSRQQRRRERSAGRERPAPTRERSPARERGGERSAPAPDAGPEPTREPRHVHAVPTGEDSKIAAAVEAFNRSEHPRTVAGVARSLGAPAVAVLPDHAHPSLVRVVASWELCWYRYEVDLGSERTSVRLDGQGYELSELTAQEQVQAAVADDAGQLHVAVG
jgi:hypothetical protein